MYKTFYSFALIFLTICSPLKAQDTFSIVAVDPVTGEVGSAGASCVDLANFGLPPDFLGVLFPGVGAINSQAYYIPQNQTNATNRMLAGDSPQEIIDWLVGNDVQGNPALRQYGVVRIIDNEGHSAAHTGVGTDDYKGHRTGPTYSIQGNILLGPEILDSMEYKFLNTEGDLAHKLMAAMQGANVIGADSRCTDNGTSSLFAFLKVAQPDDEFGDPSLVLGVDFADNTGMEPIDSLQILFNQVFPPVGIKEVLKINTQVYPNPAQSDIVFEVENTADLSDLELNVFDASGKKVYQKPLIEFKTLIPHSLLGSGKLFVYQLQSKSKGTFKSGKIIFF